MESLQWIIFYGVDFIILKPKVLEILKVDQKKFIANLI